MSEAAMYKGPETHNDSGWGGGECGEQGGSVNTAMCNDWRFAWGVGLNQKQYIMKCINHGMGL